MSLFKGENAYPKVIQWQPKTFGVGESIPEGAEWYDAVQKTLVFNGVSGVANVAAMGVVGVNVTATNVTNVATATNLMSIALPANSMNVVGKTLRVTAAGTYTNAGGATNASIITFTLALGATTVLTFVTPATTNTATGMPWKLEADIATLTTGTSGAVVADGEATLTTGTNATATTTHTLIVPAGNVSFNCQTVSNVIVAVAQSTVNASSVVNQQFMKVEIGN